MSLLAEAIGIELSPTVTEDGNVHVVAPDEPRTAYSLYLSDNDGLAQWVADFVDSPLGLETARECVRLLAERHPNIAADVFDRC